MKTLAVAKTPTKRSVQASRSSRIKPIPLFDTLGYGFDIVSGKSRRRVFKPSFENASTFVFRNDKYAVAEGLLVDPSPHKAAFRRSSTTVERDIHDYQQSLAASMGVKAESFGEFAHSGGVAHRRQWFTEGYHYLVSSGGSYSFFEMRLDPTYEGLVEPALLKALDSCKNREAFEDFFERYGTHVVVSGEVGGLMSMEIEVDVSKIDQSEANETFLQSQGSLEIEGITVESSASFSNRTSKTSSSYRSSSSRSVSLVGGRITADSYSDWRKSLEVSPLPDLTVQNRSIAADRPGLAMMKVRGTEDIRNNPPLALTNLQLLSLAKLLPSAGSLRKTVQEEIDLYVRKHRIEATRNKLVPLVGGSGSVHSVTPGSSYSENAWALKKTHVKFGLEAHPGVKCEVHVMHPLAGDNSYTLWSGQTNEASWFYSAGRITVTFTCNDPSGSLKVRIW